MSPARHEWRVRRNDHILPFTQETRCEAAYSLEEESNDDADEGGTDRPSIGGLDRTSGSKPSRGGIRLNFWS